MGTAVCNKNVQLHAMQKRLNLVREIFGRPAIPPSTYTSPPTYLFHHSGMADLAPSPQQSLLEQER